jgi:Response regulator of the LytR/AlgR family
MQKQTCILIDDEAHALGALGDIVKRIPGLEEKARYTDVLAALSDLQSGQIVDFIFSDIEMPDLTGLEAAKLLRPHCRCLVFTTAHSKYAVDAFAELADGFLLKPLALPAVLDYVEKLRKKERGLSTSPMVPNNLFLKNGGKHGFVRVGYDEIICVDGGDHYPTIVTRSSTVPVYMTMNELEEHLAERKDFIRIRNNCIVSLGKVTKIDGNTVYLALDRDNTREVSVTYRKPFFDTINRQTLISKKNK